MADESDAVEIQKERERRRSAERLRIAKEREARREEVARLRSGAARAKRPEAPARSSSPGPREGPSPAPGRWREAQAPGGEPPAGGAAFERTLKRIGGPIVRPEVEAFLATDPTDRFDLQGVNSLRLANVAEAAGGDPELLREISERAALLMARVKQEVDDPLNAGAFLRERVLEWYRESAGAPGWAAGAALRWSGLFADSRASGGKLHPWVNVRLRALREEATRAGRVGTRLRQSLLGDRRDQATTTRTAHQQIVAEVAQAILDDLAVHPREVGAPCPLVRLSELAVRRQVATINDVLALLFSSPDNGPFVVLHPNRYPDCEELSIRPPLAAAAGAALAYRLVPGVPSRRPGARGKGGEGGPPGESGSEAPSEGASELEEEGSTIWDAATVPPETWTRLAEARRRERRRLETPPKDYRARAAYEPLVSLVLESAEFRKLFLAARWRGRPAGLPLLATLLQRGKFAPEVATDHEYLDAELDALLEEGTGTRAGPDAWKVRGWTVRREGNHAEGFRYVAERDTAGG